MFPSTNMPPLSSHRLCFTGRMQKPDFGHDSAAKYECTADEIPATGDLCLPCLRRTACIKCTFVTKGQFGPSNNITFRAPPIVQLPNKLSKVHFALMHALERVKDAESRTSRPIVPFSSVAFMIYPLASTVTSPSGRVEKVSDWAEKNTPLHQPPPFLPR